MSDIISTDTEFSAGQRQQLAWLADQMIPADGNLPGAGSPAVQSEALPYLAKNAATVAAALSALDELVSARGRSAVAELGRDECEAVISGLKLQESNFIELFQAAIVSVYYRQDAVLTALGLPARQPFPEGNRVGATDWTLLDSVRDRAPFYRQAD